MTAKLTAKQQIFIMEYLTDMNATQAAIRAGYSAKTAYSIGQENLKKPEIKEAISAAVSEREKRTEITADFVIMKLIEIVDRCMQRAPVFRQGEQLVDEQGRNVWTFDAKNALKALELLGRNLGMFVDRREPDTCGEIHIRWLKD